MSVYLICNGGSLYLICNGARTKVSVVIGFRESLGVVLKGTKALFEPFSYLLR